MSDPINIDEIMQELRNSTKNGNYPEEAIAFDAVRAREKETEDFDFFRELMGRDVRYMDRSYYVDYDQPITGRSPRTKGFTRSLYQFHLRPLWGAQNYFNLKAVPTMSQIRNFVLQQIEQNEQMEKHLEELRKVCREQELKIEQLEKKFSEEEERGYFEC